jgi:peptidoglycan/LPS O-acetylase OafA/YrhL
MIKSADIRGIVLLNGLATLLIAWLGPLPQSLPADNIRWYAVLNSAYLTAMCMTYLWSGVAFSLLWQKKISVGKAVTAVLALNAMFAIQVLVTRMVPLTSISTYNLALALFALSYATRMRWRPNRVLNFFADISYPLYAVHAAAGYCLIKWLNHVGLSVWLATCISLGLLIAIATLVHRFVERPTQALGKSLGKQLEQREPLEWLWKKFTGRSNVGMEPEPAACRLIKVMETT